MTVSTLTAFQLGEGSLDVRHSRFLHILSEAMPAFKPRACADHELHYVAAGELPIMLDGVRSVLTEGEILFVRAGQELGLGPSTKRSLSCFHVHFDFDRVRMTILDSGLDEWAATRSKVDAWASGDARTLYLPNQMPLAARGATTEAFLRLMKLQRAPDPGSAIAVDAEFLRLLQQISCEAVASLRLNQVATSPERIHVDRALDFIDRQIGHMISLREVADHVGVSAPHLARLFKSQIGTSVGAYIARRKISVAKEKLLSTRHTVKEIAASLGFADQLYFSRVFRRATGFSPQAYVSRNGMR
ncbi:MAG: helix-turn-helix transcriptional regulator [Planctomycetes bacterium]|nr:helix-turn-helix transcriptional regulator [Planctomycetota bacterium]